MEVAGGSHITPLFWQHGDDGTVICREIVQMKAAGIGSFIVEPRPHPDYLGPGWWRDLDIILDEAVRQSMQVWLFDDARFPSGYANGLIRDHHPQHLKLFLRENHLDLQGPAVNRHFGLDRCRRGSGGGGGRQAQWRQ